MAEARGRPAAHNWPDCLRLGRAAQGLAVSQDKGDFLYYEKTISRTQAIQTMGVCCQTDGHQYFTHSFMKLSHACMRLYRFELLRICSIFIALVYLIFLIYLNHKAFN